jgi:hypothetical protein
MISLTVAWAASTTVASAVMRCTHQQWFDANAGVCAPLAVCTGAQYETAPPAQTWGYELQQWGTCQYTIDSVVECEHAAKVLGLVDTTAIDDMQRLGVIWDPEGCYFESGSLKHHVYGTNTGMCTNTDQCLCRSRGHYTSDRKCSQATTCTAGTFESAQPTATSDRVCQPLTQCIHGTEYTSVKPRHAYAWVLLTDGVCDEHVESSDECDAAARFLGVRDTTSEADQQPHGVSWDPAGCYMELGHLKHHLQMRNDGKCSAIDNCLCRASRYMASDRVCSPLTTCSAREYQIAAPGHATDRVCADLTTCDAGSQYQTTAPSATSDRQCGDLTTCAKGTEYETRGATATSDRACGVLTKCAAGQFEAAVPPQRWRFVRQTWGRCEEPIAERQECNRAAKELGLHDTTAEDDAHRFGVAWDPDGCYFENGRLKHHRHGLNSGSCSPTNQCLCRGDSYDAGDRVCRELTKCSIVQFEARAPTGTSDRICLALTECTDGEYQATAPIPVAIATSAMSDVRRLGAVITPTHHFVADRQCQAHRPHCQIGTYETVAAGAQHDRQCTPCPPGTAQPKVGQTQCADCSEQAAGAFADAPGQVSCTLFEPCPAGLVRSGTSSVSGGTCTACPAGQAKASAGRWTDECLPCLAGKFAPTEGTLRCTDCKAGTFQQWTGRQMCTNCPLGRFSAVAARSAVAHCLLCPAGKFAAQKGSTVCSACSGGRFGSVSVSAMHAGHCIACPKGKFQAADGLTSCGFCPSGKYQHQTEQHHCHSCSKPNAPFTLGKNRRTAFLLDWQPCRRTCVCASSVGLLAEHLGHVVYMR